MSHDFNDLSIQGLIKSAESVYGKGPMAALAATQAILESGLYNGKPSRLAAEGYNLFGVKGQGDDGTLDLYTNEDTENGMIRVQQPFAKYKSYQSSFNAHKALMQKPRYSNVWNAKDPYEAFANVKDAGYATDRNYTRLLSQTYDKYVKPYFEGNE